MNKSLALAAIVMSFFGMATAQKGPFCNLTIINNSNVKVIDAASKTEIGPFQSATVKTSLCSLPGGSKNFQEMKEQLTITYELKPDGTMVKTVSGKIDQPKKVPVILH